MNNLMSQFKNAEKSPKIKQILEKKETQNIKTTKFEKYTLRFKDSLYFLDCVPIIPDDYNVITKWSDFLTMRVNWNKEADVQWYRLKKQYGFVVLLESNELNKVTKRKHQITCNMIFNNATVCAKHLEWFNSCFPIEVKEQHEKNIYKTKKKNKK